MRKDWQTLELCDRFFDAIEQNDYDALEACYAPEAVIWHSHDCLYQPRADNLAMLKRGMQTLPKVRFQDRRIRVFEGGFVQQHTIYVTRDSGFVGQMDVCFVGYVRDGMISRAYEYFDTGQIEKFLGPSSEHRQPERERRMEKKPKTPSIKGPSEWFTGDVWLDPIARGEEPSRVRVNAVHFTPGARTAWHSHVLGQTLFVTEGEGRIQSAGGEISRLISGDIVHTPAEEWHWHGAAPDHFMAHLSITEGIGASDRPETDWGAHVTDEEYGGEAH